ncbi:hypothetical protein AALO_G00147650 [Alosa alosa]|uniref:Protein tyrosine phosphatase n=1 Tax=Alosa alosa TaxID=278164 RepID=A0AAV6GEY9_9TELE|nr:hypothetical protein AALO_G00147650 [Alosa alosa]
MSSKMCMITWKSIHQRKLEGGTYSPREAEIVDTKFKLDQLIAVADLELKEEKINRYSSFFFRRKEIFVIQLLSYRKSLKPVTKKGFLQHVEDLCANDNAKFQEEFSELPKLLPDLATSDANLPWNRSKNRFTNVKPWLKAMNIAGYLCPNEFIATQGTVDGFVVISTGRRIISNSVWGHCHHQTHRRRVPGLDCQSTESGEEHGVPESSTTLIQFVKSIRSNHGHDNTTIVVHCSAGVGRTGVFITLNHLIQHARDHDFVDIYGLVAKLRSESMCMVQNLAQYMFLHQSTLDLLSSKSNSQSIWFVNYSALEKMDSLDAMEGDVELEWEETTM